MVSTPSSRLKAIVSGMADIGEESTVQVNATMSESSTKRIESQINSILNSYRKSLISMTPAMQEVRRYLVEEVIPTRFEEGDAGGWEELAESTIATRIKQGFGAGPILIKTGGLFRQVTMQNHWKIDKTVTTGTYVGRLSLLIDKLKNSRYGGGTIPGGQFLTQQYGSKDMNIPARPHVPESTVDLYPDEMEKVKSIFLKYFNKAPRIV
jgi:hypothetical protein